MLKKIAIILMSILFAIVLIVPAENAVIIRKTRMYRQREIEEAAEETNRICETNQTPCGWAVYKPFGRKIEYFMRNACKCPEGLKCIRTDDDASVSAFVYKCRNRTSTTTTTTSTTAIPDDVSTTTILPSS